MCTCNKPHLVDLGFTQAPLPAGTHICQIYTDESERDESLLKYVSKGLELGESVACFTEAVSREKVAEYLKEMGLSLSDAAEKGALVLSGCREVYFSERRFDPDRMLGLLTNFHEQSVQEGRTGARVIGEMSPEISTIEGGSRLLEYESRVSLLLRTRPVTAVCQYDARAFDGATIMEVLKVHPMMVVHGSVIQNPFFIPPEEILKTAGSA